MKIIVDTNIVFSCLLNTNGNIGDLLFNSDKVFKFYSCDYMRKEIEKHWDKLKRISKLTNADLQESRFRVYSKINFINEQIIPETKWLSAEKITKDIDVDDTAFVALTKHLRGHLWTGDKKLYNGLNKINFKKIISISELMEIRSEKS